MAKCIFVTGGVISSTASVFKIRATKFFQE